MQQDFECWGDHTCLNTCGRDEEVQWKWEEEALWRRAVEDQWKAAVEIAEGQWKVPVEIAEGQWKVYVEIAEGQRKALVEIGEGQRKVVGEGLLKLKLVLSRWMFWIVPSRCDPMGFIWFHAVFCSYSIFWCDFNQLPKSPSPQTKEIERRGSMSKANRRSSTESARSSRNPSTPGSDPSGRRIQLLLIQPAGAAVFTYDLCI